MAASTGPYVQVQTEKPGYPGHVDEFVGDARYPAVKQIAMDDGIVLFEEQDVVRGFLAPMPHLGPAEYKPTVKLTAMHPRPLDLQQFMCAAMGAPVAATSVFTMTEPPPSFKIVGASGDSKFQIATGMGVEELSFKFNGGILEMDASLVGLTCVDAADPTITPVLDTAAPFRKGDMTLTWLSSTAVTEDFDWKITSGIEAINAFVSGTLWPDTLQYANGALPTVSGTIGKQSMVAADIAALAAGTPFSVTIALTRASMGVSLVLPACQLVGVERDPIAAERRRAGRYMWEARYPAAGGAYATATYDVTPA